MILKNPQKFNSDVNEILISWFTEQKSFRFLKSMTPDSVIFKIYDFQIRAVDWTFTNTIMSFPVSRHSFLFTVSTLLPAVIPDPTTISAQNNIFHLLPALQLCQCFLLIKTLWSQLKVNLPPQAAQTKLGRRETESLLLAPLGGCASVFHTNCCQWRSSAGGLGGSHDGNQTMRSQGHMLLLQGRCK